MAGHHGYFAWYELLTTDIESAKDFYGKVVGWNARDASTPKLPYSLFSAENVPVAGLMELPVEARKKGAMPRWAAYVAVDDIDAVARRLKRLGGTVYVPPTDTNIGRISIVADPHTATFALVSGLKPELRQAAALSEPGHVGWHELLAEDWKKAFAFYGELFGWQKAEYESVPSDKYQLFSAGGRMLGGMYDKRLRQPFSFWLLYFNVGDLDAAMGRIKSAGGRVDEGPAELPDGDWIARCSDPQGTAFAARGTRHPDAIKRADSDVSWSTEWGGIATRGRLVVPPKRSK